MELLLRSCDLLEPRWMLARMTIEAAEESAKQAAPALAERVRRPLWQAFNADEPGEEAAAAAWVRRGGMAVLESRGRLQVLTLQSIHEKRHVDFGEWVRRYFRISGQTVRVGPMAGLVTSRVPSVYREEIELWLERDRSAASRGIAEFEMLALDCMECAACCIDNRVTLEPYDLEQLAKVNPKFAKKPWIRTERGVKLLSLDSRTKRCRHLQEDNLCGIYSSRPYDCKSFPAGTECCLSARREKFGPGRDMPDM